MTFLSTMYFTFNPNLYAIQLYVQSGCNRYLGSVVAAVQCDQILATNFVTK